MHKQFLAISTRVSFTLNVGLLLRFGCLCNAQVVDIIAVKENRETLQRVLHVFGSKNSELFIEHVCGNYNVAFSIFSHVDSLHILSSSC